MSRTPILLVAVLLAATLVQAQTVLHGEENLSPWTVGAGFSDFDMDWSGGQRMEGVTAWLDWRVPVHTPVLNRIGVEIEGREIDFGRPSSLPGMRQETGTGGLIFAVPAYKRLHPYVKGMYGFGGVYFGTSGYDHDTRELLAGSGGVDYRLRHGFGVRAEYEYQSWHKLFSGLKLHPNGVTVGVVYTIASHH